MSWSTSKLSCGRAPEAIALASPEDSVRPQALLSQPPMPAARLLVPTVLPCEWPVPSASQAPLATAGTAAADGGSSAALGDDPAAGGCPVGPDLGDVPAAGAEFVPDELGLESVRAWDAADPRDEAWDLVDAAD